MHPALWLLIKLKSRSTVRRLASSLKTFKGILVLLLMLGLGAIIIVPNFMLLLSNEIDAGFGIRYRNYVSLAVFSFFIVALLRPGKGSIIFLPEEIEALFPGPFTRRQILIYKIFGILIRMPLVALFLSIVYGAYLPHFVCALVGMTLTMTLIQLGPMLLSLLSHVSYAGIANRNKKIIAILLIVIVGVLAIQSLPGVWSGETEVEYEGQTSAELFASEVAQSNLGRIILAPVNVFVDTLFSPQIDMMFFIHVAIAFSLLVLLLWSILVLDSNFLEMNLKESKRWAERIQKAKSGGAAISISKKEYKWSIPMFPFWRGMGPVIWRQVLTVLRLGGSFVFLGLLLVAVMVGAIMARQNAIEQESIRMISSVVVGMMSFMFSLMGPVGFRPDIERIQVLKGLPLSDFSVVLGQLLGGVLVISGVQILLLSVLALFYLDITFVIMMACVLPFNFLLLSVSNTMLLLFPVRTDPANNDAISGGQGLLSFFAIYLALILVGVAIGVPSGMVYLFMGSAVLAILTGVVIGLVCCFAFLKSLQWAYRRFDVALHSPT